MTSWCIAIDGGGELRYWTYGNPGKWTPDKDKARLYARRQSAANARVLLLKYRKDVSAETLKVLEF